MTGACTSCTDDGMVTLSTSGVQWTEEQVRQIQLQKDSMHSRHGPALQDTLGQHGDGPCQAAQRLC